MKKLFYLSMLSILFACEKSEEKSFIGNLQEGDDYKTCYSKIQTLYQTKKIENYLHFNNEESSDLAALSGKLSLYSEIYIVEKESRDTIIFSFNGDTLSFISNKNKINPLLGFYEGVAQWPQEFSADTCIKKGDTKSELIEKLQTLEKRAYLPLYFESSVLTIKDLGTNYDTSLEHSNQWTIIDAELKDNSRVNFSLLFRNGKLYSVEKKPVKVVGYL